MNLVFHETNASFGDLGRVADTVRRLNLTIPPRNVPSPELGLHAELLFWLGRFREARTAMLEVKSREPGLIATTKLMLGTVLLQV